MAQKAVEMGARRLRPVITRHTQVARVNLERLRANAIEACEQCGVIWIPEIAPVEPLGEALKSWPAERLLVFCDEEAEQASPLDALAGAREDGGVGLLIGPEGGFDDDERAAILSAPRVLRLSLGPRILRADTAAVAALTLIQATLGDWPKRHSASLSLPSPGAFAILPPRCGFIPADNDSPFHRRVAQGCSDSWGAQRAFVGDHWGKSAECGKRRGRCGRTLSRRCAGPIARDQTRIWRAGESRMRADQRLYHRRRALRVRRADRRPTRPVRADR